MSSDYVMRALPTRRYLRSVWPWRSLAFVVTTFPVLLLVSTGFAMVALPWIVAADMVWNGHMAHPAVVILVLMSAAAVVTVGPLLAVPLGVLERQRLGIVDGRPIASGHRAASGLRWLQTRYREPATWRELAYLLLLATVGPFVYGALALLVFFDALLLASPLIMTMAQDPVALWFTEVETAWEVMHFAIVGLLLVPPMVYLTGLLAGGHASLARALLGDSGGAALREVAQSRARLADAFEAERRRIERDLHDGAQHRLTSLTLQLAVARLDVADDSPAAQSLDNAHAQAKELMVVLRDLIHGVRPQTLTELGLAAAVRELAGRSPIPVTVTVTGANADHLGGERGRPPERLESAAYFAVSEALANAAKHSHASAVRVRLGTGGGTLIVEVSDDGRGGADPRRGTGLTGLADRVAAVGGRLLLSSPAGGPTLVRVELPW